jgi:hypothetical protein
MLQLLVIANVVPSLIEATRPSATSVLTRTSLLHISEHCFLQDEDSLGFSLP